MTIQKTITLSDRADAEFAEVADWKGMPTAKLLAQIIEAYHQSGEFSELIKRARDEKHDQAYGKRPPASDEDCD